MPCKKKATSVFDKKKPIWKAFGNFGTTKKFDKKSDAEKWAKYHDGVVIHVGWKLKKMM